MSISISISLYCILLCCVVFVNYLLCNVFNLACNVLYLGIIIIIIIMTLHLCIKMHCSSYHHVFYSCNAICISACSCLYIVLRSCCTTYPCFVTVLFLYNLSNNNNVIIIIKTLHISTLCLK